jgi:hypothetical protein
VESQFVFVGSPGTAILCTAGNDHAAERFVAYIVALSRPRP